MKPFPRWKLVQVSWSRLRSTFDDSFAKSPRFFFLSSHSLLLLVSPSSSVMPSAVRKQNRKPSNQKPPPAKPVQSQQPQPQQTSAAAAVTPSASSSKSPAAKQVLKSTEPQSELIVYNVQLEDDGSPAQSKTVGPLYPPEFPGTPRLFFSFFLLADRS